MIYTCSFLLISMYYLTVITSRSCTMTTMWTLHEFCMNTNREMAPFVYYKYYDLGTRVFLPELGSTARNAAAAMALGRGRRGCTLPDRSFQKLHQGSYIGSTAECKHASACLFQLFTAVFLAKFHKIAAGFITLFRSTAFL